MIQTIAVIGAGTMGNGIAHVFAQHGFRVHLVDVSQPQLDKGLATIQKNAKRQLEKGLIDAGQLESLLLSIIPHNSITGVSGTQLVVEAATENEELKKNIFRQLDQLAPPECILATNTSSISITGIAAVTERPSQVIGMHFMNPVPVMKLVEVINGYATAPETTATVLDLCKKLGKVPAIAGDYPGFIANRILMPMINEAIISLQEGVGSITAIDTVMKLGMAHPMGPLQLADFIGLDVCLSILRVMQEGTGNPKYAPATLLVNMVRAGKLGVKSGEGFYLHQPGSRDPQPSPRFN